MFLNLWGLIKYATLAAANLKFQVGRVFLQYWYISRGTEEGGFTQCLPNLRSGGRLPSRERDTPYSLGGGVLLGSRKSYPLLDQILWPYTRLKMLNCSWFQSFVSDPVKRDPILDQFSMITRPYTRVNGLKTIPFPAVHIHMANIWVYPPKISFIEGYGYF